MLCQRLDATNKTHIQKAADLIRAGHLVAFPTETVYGLGALGLNPEAIQKIFDAKNRPNYNPLILHVSSAEKALELVDLKSTDLFWQLAQKYWPGPLTLVAPKAQVVPLLATGGLDKVAVRVPRNPVALELLKWVDAPIAAPSANLSGRPSSTTAEHVLLTLGNRISAILDAGPCEYGLESTVLDISKTPAVILRLGALDLQDFDFEHSEKIAGSPGRLDKHYAPLIAEIRWASPEEIKQAPSDVTCLVCTQNSTDYARDLFAKFYAFEQAGVKRLWIEHLPKDKAWNALRDRIQRALS